MRPRMFIQGSKEIPNPICPSWWAEYPRPGFTARAEAELPRMRSSKFSRVNRGTVDGPTLPSSLELYRARKRIAGAA